LSIQLYIIPAAGGTARRLRANTRLMNSWHCLSPNRRWLVFSSKARSPYTQMYLTHIDENSAPLSEQLANVLTELGRKEKAAAGLQIAKDRQAKGSEADH